MIGKLNAVDKVDGAAKLLIYLLCVGTNATKSTIKIKGFHNKKTGDRYGDYKITIVKTK